MNTPLIAVISLGLGGLIAVLLSRIVYYARIGHSKRRRLLAQLLDPHAEEASTAKQVAQRVEISSRILPDFDRELVWARLVGVNVTQEELIGYTVMTTLLGIIAGLLLFDLPGALLGLGGFYLPHLWLKSKSKAARNRFRRQLPEMLQVLAAEASSGVGLVNALERLGQSHSMVGAVFQRLLHEAQAQSGPLWSRPNGKEGNLKRLVRAWGSKDLLSLISQLETIHRRGVEGPETMAKMARSAAQRFLGEARTEAEQLENKLVLPLGIFFFLPFTAATIAPIITMLTSIF
jgi:Flp pilus assembly protein TadB